MSKLPQYMICENPLIGDGRVFVMQSRPFFMIAQALHFDESDEDLWLKAKAKTTVGASTELRHGQELVLLHSLFADVPQGAPQSVADQLAGSMRKMADWYRAYLIWEDKQIEKDFLE